MIIPASGTWELTRPAPPAIGTPSRAPWSHAVHICALPESERPPGQPGCPSCADDHDYAEELIHGPGGWYHGPLNL